MKFLPLTLSVLATPGEVLLSQGHTCKKVTGISCQLQHPQEVGYGLTAGLRESGQSTNVIYIYSQGKSQSNKWEEE